MISHVSSRARSIMHQVLLLMRAVHAAAFARVGDRPVRHQAHVFASPNASQCTGNGMRECRASSIPSAHVRAVACMMFGGVVSGHAAGMSLKAAVPDCLPCDAMRLSAPQWLGQPQHPICCMFIGVHVQAQWCLCGGCEACMHAGLLMPCGTGGVHAPCMHAMPCHAAGASKRRTCWCTCRWMRMAARR